MYDARRHRDESVWNEYEHDMSDARRTDLLQQRSVEAEPIIATVASGIFDVDQHAVAGSIKHPIPFTCKPDLSAEMIHHFSNEQLDILL